MNTSGARSQRAVSLVEAMVVLAVLGILLAVAIPSMSEFVRKKRIEGLAEEIRADFALAKSISATVDQMGRVVWHQVDSSNGCYTMFVGTNTSITCNCTLPLGQTCGAKASQELKVFRGTRRQGHPSYRPLTRQRSSMRGSKSAPTSSFRAS